MSETRKNRQPRTMAIALVVLVVAAIAAFVAVYGIDGRSGNEVAGGGQTCQAARALTAHLDGKATGQLAAFQVVDEPKPIPDIAFLDGAGTSMKISDWKGRTVLLNLWATWCAPCRHEMPALDALQRELGGEDFEMVAVSVDRGEPDKPKAFFEEIGIASLAFYADGTMAVFNDLKQAGYAFGMPSTVLIDAEGCVLGVLNGPAEWASPEALDLIRTALGRHSS